MTTYVAVIGAGLPDPETDAIAEAVGHHVATAGAVVVCGGLSGVMESACRGAAAAGGTTIGLLPGDDRRHANPHVRIAIPTGMGEGRNVLVVRAADVVIAVGGEFGTLSEIGLALKMGKPVVGLGTWELQRQGEPVPAIVVAQTADDAVQVALALAAER